MEACQNLKVQNAINTSNDDNIYNKPTIAVMAKAEYLTPLMPNSDSTVSHFAPLVVKKYLI
jgi:hypothetical protein